MKQILFIIDPFHDINPEKDTTILFKRECYDRGHKIYFCEINNMSFGSTLKARCIELREKYLNIERHSVRNTTISRDYPLVLPNPEEISLEEMDIIFMRKDPPVDLGYIHSTYMLDTIKDKVLIVNNPTSLRSFNEKLVTLNFQDIIPSTIVSSSLTEIEDFAKKYEHGVVIKPTTLCGGEGVVRYEPINNKDLHAHSGRQPSALQVLLGADIPIQEDLIEEPKIVQEFLPNVLKGDKSIILLDGEPIGAINRVAQDGSFICNFHAGGRPEKTEITKSDKKICNKIKPFLVKNGIYFAGIDVIDNMLTEINITSPTGLQEINRANNTKLESIVLDSILDKLHR